MEDQHSHTDTAEAAGSTEEAARGQAAAYDYDFVDATARIAVYDDMLSSPRIIDIEPDSTREFINALATSVYDSAKGAGGTIPYSIILQVAENFIHSQFKEMVVSVLDGGNTIRFSDQGPGIPDKEKAQRPGYSSATAPMKRYINGVGSGLPIVREYMETKHGTVRIEDNMDAGAVVTISLNAPATETANADSAGTAPATETFPVAGAAESAATVGAAVGAFPAAAPARAATTAAVGNVPMAGYSGAAANPVEMIMGTLSKRALQIMKLFAYEDIWGVKDIADETKIPTSSTYSELKKLEEAGIMTRLGKKYRLTEFGDEVARNIS